MTKSMEPSSRAHRSAAAWRLSIYQRGATLARTCCPLSTAGAYLADIATADANNLGTGPDLCDFLGRLLGLSFAAADDAGVGTHANEGPGLHAANGASAARHKHHTVLCERDVSGPVAARDVGGSTEEAIAPDGAQIL